MYELKIQVTKVREVCTADPPMKPGDYFTVRDGDIRLPEGGYICLWALQSILPLITPKEREILEGKDEDWMWRVHHAQCPDPKGKVIFKIERIGKLNKGAEKAVEAHRSPELVRARQRMSRQVGDSDTLHRQSGQIFQGFELPPKEVEEAEDARNEPERLKDLRVIVKSVKGKCTSGMKPGNYFILRSGRLYIPAARHFCLYALHAVLPLLPAKQRPLEEGDWLKEDSHVICPDPAGNVVMRIEPYLR